MLRDRVLPLALLAVLALPGGRSSTRGDNTPSDSDTRRIAQLTLTLPRASIERIKQATARSGLSLAGYISASVGCARWNSTFAGEVVTIERSNGRFITQLPSPGLLTPCPCHQPIPAHCQPNDYSGPPIAHRNRATFGSTTDTQTITPKITRRARNDLRTIANDNPGGRMTMQEYVDAATWVEQWNYDHRDSRISVERPDGRYELLLPYAGIVQGIVVNT